MTDPHKPAWNPNGPAAPMLDAIYPQSFTSTQSSRGAELYLREPLVRKVVDFFENKGLAALKAEDQSELWYADWVDYQASHQLYARLLSPQKYSRLGSSFDLFRYTRFIEVCAYFSPAHLYSLQVTFLGLSAILIGANLDLKCEAVQALENGGLLAFGISEQKHGADLLATAFTVAETEPGRLAANGTKYYIGNSNVAALIVILAKQNERKDAEHSRRAPTVLFALRPGKSKGFRNLKKIRTLGIRAAFVGEFEVKDHALLKEDIIASNRQAWDAVFGTVSLGKFFLGFGTIGICERAFEEAAAHLRTRMLYGKPAIEIPHIQATMVLAFARLTAMKLYAYRALDYIHSSSASDRRYLLFTAVQKAKLSTEGVKVMALLSECIGARGFESETYFEMALRDVLLVPGLEGSTHINLGLTDQFIPRYFSNPNMALREPGSLVAGEVGARENTYLMEAHRGAAHMIEFPDFLKAYEPLLSVPNVKLFAKAVKAFQLFVQGLAVDHTSRAEMPSTLALGQCLAIVAYAQLIAENIVRLQISRPLTAALFHALANDFNTAALALASCWEPSEVRPIHIRRMIAVSRITQAELEALSKKMLETAGAAKP